MRWCYLHLARFPIQRRVLETPSLRGKPLVLVEEVRGARAVAFASSAALKLGIRPGMTLSAATALEPELAAAPYVPLAERAALASLGEALMAIAPGFQLSAPDGLWLDASAAPLCGGEEGLCRRALELCSAQGYRAHAVVASEAFTSRALGRHGARRSEVVPPGSSFAALAPLPLAALDCAALSRATVRQAFGSLGLSTLAEVAALPPGAVVARLGAEGLWAHRLCRGEDDSPFTPEPLPEVLEEQLALDWPAESIEPLLFALKTALDRLGARLSGRRRAAVRVTFTLRLDPSGQAQVGLTLARPTAQPKLLLELARHRLTDLTLEHPVAAIQVRVEESCEDQARQLNLGEEPAGDASLEVVLSRLATTLGEEALFAAELESLHRPESAYAARAFHPPVREGGIAAESGREAAEASPEEDAAWVERPSRLFAKAASLQAEVGAAGEIVSARLLGRRRKATAVAGPERLLGEWWADSPYCRDYYRVHFEGIGPVWIYRDARDGRFYLQGMFD